MWGNLRYSQAEKYWCPSVLPVPILRCRVCLRSVVGFMCCNIPGDVHTAGPRVTPEVVRTQTFQKDPGEIGKEAFVLSFSFCLPCHEVHRQHSQKQLPVDVSALRAQPEDSGASVSVHPVLAQTKMDPESHFQVGSREARDDEVWVLSGSLALDSTG